VLLTNVPVHLCRRRCGKFGLLRQSATIPLGGIRPFDWLCFLSTMAS